MVNSWDEPIGSRSQHDRTAAVGPKPGSLVLARPRGTGPERTSSYTIYVGIPGDAAHVMLVHGYTGACDRVSRGVARYLLSLHAPGTEAAVPEAVGHVVLTRGAPPSIAALHRLRVRGYLTRMTPEEEQTFLSAVVARLEERFRQQPPSYTVIPTYACNLQCTYCYQRQLRAGEQSRSTAGSMDRAMLDRVWKGMDQIDDACRLGLAERHPRDITLYGGEPLLSANRHIVSYLIGKARAAGGARFYAVTNGTELDAYRDLLGPGKIGGIQVTVDGPPAVHDARRRYADGTGSFHKISANVSMALDLGTHVDLRINLDRSSVEHIDDTLSQFRRLGWDQSPFFRSYVAPVTACNKHMDGSAALTTWQLRRDMGRHLTGKDAAASLHEIDDELRAAFIATLRTGAELLPLFKPTYCGAQISVYVIDFLGHVYACWERAGDPAARIGHLSEQGEVQFNRPVAERWRGRTVASLASCMKCRYVLFCGGGCAAIAWNMSGPTGAPYCDGYARRFHATVRGALASVLVPRQPRFGLYGLG